MGQNPVLLLAITEIASAFGDGPPPAEEEIVSPTEFPWDRERDEVRTFLSGKRWKEITIEALEEYVGDQSAILGFLTPKAFSYYLPAFLTVSLTDHVRADVTVYTTLFRFARCGDPEIDAFRTELIGSLSIVQLDAVASAALALEVVYGPDHIYTDAIIDIERIKRERGS
jgi:hypothetical protein